MKDSVYSFSLNLQNYNEWISVPIPQNDSSRTLNITILDGSKPYEFEKDCIVVARVEGAEDHACTIRKNVVILNVPKDFVKTEGTVNCVLEIYGSDGARLVTLGSFEIKVVNTGFPGTATGTEEERGFYNQLSDAIVEVGKAKDNAEHWAKMAESAGTKANTEAENAKTQAEMAEVAAGNANIATEKATEVYEDTVKYMTEFGYPVVLEAEKQAERAETAADRANAIAESIEKSVKEYTSADFMQGFRQVGTGLITDGNESLYRIVNTNMPKVTAGDKVYVTPAEGFSVDVAVTDTDDYANVTSYLQHIPHNAASYECEIIYDGYLNIDVMSTVGVKVSPSDYACDIRVVSEGIKERLSDVENILDVVAESTEVNTANINTLTVQVQDIIPQKAYTSADFVQGWRQLGVGFEEVTTYITNAKLLKVKAGNKMTVNPNGYKLWISVADTDDYSVSGKTYSLNKNNVTEYFEHTFEVDGYLNINVNNFGNRIEPGNYTCDISVIFDNTDERLSEVEYNLKSAETLSSKSKLFTTIVNDCQDMSQWKSSSGSVVADNDCIMWNQSLRCNGEMRCTVNTYDLLNNDLVFKIRINSIENGSSIVLRLGNTSNSSVGATYELMRGADTTPTGEWREITVPYSVYKQQSSGVDFGAVNDIHIYADNLSTSGVDGVADWNIQYIGTRPRKLNKGIVSFTFDDGYKTQYTGVKLLAEKGITSTIYHIAEATGQGEILSTEELQELVNYYGADIEVHGDIPVNAEGENGYNALSDEELIEHWSYSQKFLKENGLSEGRHMSYPGNYHNNRVVQLAKKFFDSCRTIQYYIPCETYPPADHHRLRAVSSVGASGNDVATIKKHIDQAMASGSWLILTLHRIGDVPSGQEANASMYCSESDLQAIADYAIESGAMIKNIAEVYNTPSTSVGKASSSDGLENVIITAEDFEAKEEQLTDDVVPSMALFYNAFVGHEERLLSLEEDYTQALELLGGAE